LYVSIQILDMFKQLDFRILAYSVVASLLLVSDNYFNYIGWAVFGIAQTSLILYFKKDRTRLDWFFGIAAIVSTINFVFYTNFVTLLFSAIIYLYASGWLISKLPRDRVMQIMHLFVPYFSSYISVMQFRENPTQLSSLVGEVSSTPSKASEPKKISTAKSSNWTQMLFSSLVTLGVLSIILPLLSFANPQFGIYLKNLFEFQWIKDTFEWIIENIFSFTTIFRAFVIVFVYKLIPKLIYHCRHHQDAVLEEKKDMQLSIPKIVTVFTLFAFLAVQVQTTLNPGLLTKAAGDIANETFFQLSVVCFVAFWLVYLNYKDTLSTKIWSIILLIQSLILSAIAFNSDWSYVVNWGLTHKRLYGFSVVSIVVGMIMVFVYFAYHNSRKLVQGIAVVFCFVSVVTNAINMDKLIYDNPPKEASGVEQNYVNELGLDTRNIKTRYENVVNKYDKIGKDLDTKDDCRETSWLGSYNRQIDYLIGKYSRVVLLDWNYSEFVNYLEVKNIKLKVAGSNTEPSTPVSTVLKTIAVEECYVRGNIELGV
jgi:hypothetical protein